MKYSNDTLQADPRTTDLLDIQVEESNGSLIVHVNFPEFLSGEIVASISPRSVLFFSINNSSTEFSVLKLTPLPVIVEPGQAIASLEPATR